VTLFEVVLAVMVVGGCGVLLAQVISTDWEE